MIVAIRVNLSGRRHLFESPSLGSLEQALKKSGAKVVWFFTDFWGRDGGSRKKEAQMGMNMVDAICSADGGQGQVDYVV